MTRDIMATLDKIYSQYILMELPVPVIETGWYIN